MKLLPILAVLAVSLALVAALPVALGAPDELPPAEPALDVVPNRKEAPQVAATTAPQATPESPSEQEELTPDGWQIIAPGIDYREFHLPDPNNVFVARMERANQDNIVESAIAQGTLASGRETVTGMADRYDQTINYWGGKWGARSKVVVAINGYYFDPTTGIPHRGQIQSNWYVKRFDDLENGSGFVWKTDRNVFMGECIRHPSDKQFITVLKSGKIQFFQGVNVPREDNQLIVYTPQYDSDTNTGDETRSVEALVQLSKPATLLKASEMITGTVRSIRKNVGSAKIPFDYIILSARGTARDQLLDADKSDLKEGDVIGITQKISNCSSSLGLEWLDIYASIGGHFYFLKNGVIQSYPDNTGATSRHPRTAIAYDDQYIYFIVVDGRDPFTSIGMTTDELAVFSRDKLGARYGVSEDGGGSSTMVVNGQVKNNTFCNNYFCQGKIFLPLITGSGGSQSSDRSDDRAGQSRLLPPPPAAPDDDGEAGSDTGTVEQDQAGKIQRLVANGMFMVITEPITQTETFTTSQSVTLYSSANLRLGPGTNYTSLGTLPVGTNGTILNDSHGLNGVLATGYNWWKVDFGGGLIGWMNEQSLTPPAATSYVPNSFWGFR